MAERFEFERRVAEMHLAVRTVWLWRRLFEQITQLDESYPTRSELRTMRASAAEMAERVGLAC